MHVHEHEHEHGAGFAVGLRYRVDVGGRYHLAGSIAGATFAAGLPFRVVHEHEHEHGVAFAAVPPSGIEYEYGATFAAGLPCRVEHGGNLRGRAT